MNNHVQFVLCALGISLGVELASAQSTMPAAKEAAAAQAAAAPGVTQMVLSNICNYCIAAKDVAIKAEEGKEPFPVTRLAFQTGQLGTTAYIAVGVHQRNGTDAGLPPSGFAHQLKSPFIELKPGYFMQNFDYKEPGDNHPDARLKIPVIVPASKAQTDGLWSKLIRKQHVCLGSRFEVYTYYFLGADNWPMAEVAKQGIPVSKHFRELPSGPTQTICEGELKDVNEVFQGYAEEQTKKSIEAFNKRLSTLPMERFVKEATIAWLKDNVTTLTAMLKLGPPAGETQPPKR